MALLSTEVLPDNTLEEFRIEFNKLITDVTGLSLGNTFDTQIIFEGTTDDTFETALSVTDPTADRSIVFPDQSGNVILDSANISLADNIELQFGTGTDLKIFHDSNNSIIRDSGTGALFLEGSVVAIRNAASDETMAQFTQDGAAQLYHNNVAILATAATGISVAGDVVATDDLILDSDAAVIQLGDDQEVTLTHVHNTGVLLNAAMVVQFRDSAINIGSPADGDLDINADDEIELNSTLIDINGNVEISGTTAQVGVLTTTATQVATGGITSGSNIVSDTDSTDDLGTTSVRWANLFVDGITATDQITATGFTGTLDGILGSGTAAAASVTTLTASGIIKTDDTTAATSTTDGSLQTDGGLSVVLDAVIGDDLLLLSDAAVLSFGANSEVTLTHVHNDGLLLNTDMQLQFRDSAINIRSDDDGDLDINADDEIELNSTLIDINGNVQISGTLAQADAITIATNKKIIFRDAAIHISSTDDGDLAIAADDEIDITSTLIDINGNLDVSGTYTGGGVMTTGGNIVIPDAGTIGSASDTGAISIAADGTVDLDTAGATVASAAIKTAGKESIWIPSGAMYPSTTNGCAAIAQVETVALRPDLKVLDFATGADEFAQFSIAFPKSWNEGTVTFQPYWTVTGTNTGTVAWQLAACSVSSDGNLSLQFGTRIATTALAHSGTSNDLMVSVESGALTIAGSPAVDDQCFFQINRDTSADAQSGDARLLGLKLFFTTDVANDA